MEFGQNFRLLHQALLRGGFDVLFDPTEILGVVHLRSCISDDLGVLWKDWNAFITSRKDCEVSSSREATESSPLWCLHRNSNLVFLFRGHLLSLEDKCLEATRVKTVTL